MKKRAKGEAKPAAIETTGPRRPVDYDALRPVSKVARLIDIQPMRVSAEAHAFLRDVRIGKLGERLRYRAKRQGSSPESVIVSVEYEHETLNGERTVATASGRIAVVYLLTSANAAELDPDLLDVFAWVNGLYNSWSYLRELLSSSLARVGLHGVILPPWYPPSEIPIDASVYSVLSRSAEGARRAMRGPPE